MYLQELFLRMKVSSRWRVVCASKGRQFLRVVRKCMLHETSVGDGKEVFLQKNQNKVKELTFYAIRGVIHSIY